MAGVGGIDGLITGLDTLEIINKILSLDRRPIENLQIRIAELVNVRTAYETIEASLLALKIDAARLYREDRFLSFSAVSSDEDVITATACSSASKGLYTITVSQLAQNHQAASQEFSDTDTTTVGTGTLKLSIGSASPIEITVDSSNNTLDGVARAINDADAGISAVVVNTGGSTPAYKLLLSGSETGASEQIVIEENLTGGAGLGFGSVAGVVYGTWNGSSEVTSGGTYTGDSDAVFQFTVTQGGTVGTDTITIDYTDGGSVSGTITIPSGTEAGAEFHVHGGLKISLGSGTVIEGETFSIDTTSSTIQAPVNALMTLGSTAGGGTPIEVESGANTVTDLIEGVTLELNQAAASTPVTISVNVDTGEMEQKIKDFVDHYNDIVRLFNRHFSYDAELEEEGGELFGDAYAMRISHAVRRQVMDTVQGLGQDLTSLTVLGVGTGTDGTLTIDSSALQEALRENHEEVVRLFSTTGTSTDSSIQFLFASSMTKPSYLLSDDGYEVKITVAASQALQSGSSITSPTAQSPLVIDESNNRLKITLDGRTSAELQIDSGAYTSGTELAEEIESKINADDTLGASRVDVIYVDDGGGMGHFEFTSRSYGSTSTMEFETVASNSIYGDIGVTAGVLARGTNVAGTINGEVATGSGRILTGDDDNEYTDGLQILVTLSPEQLAEQGEAQGYVTISKGVGTRVSEYVNTVTDVNSGAITYRKQALSGMENSFQGQIDLIEAKLEKKKERLVKQFIQLETAIQELQSQSEYMTSAFSALSNITNYRSSRRY